MSTGFRSALYANGSCCSRKVSFKLYADTAKLHCFTLPCWLIVSQLHLQGQASAFTFVFSTKIFLTYIPHTHTKKNNSGGEPQHTAYIFASFFGMSFFVFLLGVCNKYKPNSVYHKSTDNMGFLSNEMHPDDVCMNLFMSEADTGGETRQAQEQPSKWISK